MPLHHFRHGCSPQPEIDLVVQCLVAWRCSWWWVAWPTCGWLALIGSLCGPLLFIGIIIFCSCFFKTSLLMKMECLVLMKWCLLLALNYVIINICTYFVVFLFIPSASLIWWVFVFLLFIFVKCLALNFVIISICVYFLDSCLSPLFL